MASPTRNQVMTALFALVSSAAPFAWTERKVRLWGDVPQDQRPYLGMGERQENNAGNTRGLAGAPVVRTWHAEFFVYTWAKDLVGSAPPGSPVPADLLNPLLDAIEDAMQPDALTGRQTLGGLVTHAWIVGDTLKVPGDIDGDGMAIIPVSILVP